MRRWWRPVLLAVLLLAGGLAVLRYGVPPVAEIRGRVDGAGWVAPLVFALLYAGLSLVPAPVACVPRNSDGLETMIWGVTWRNAARHAAVACL